MKNNIWMLVAVAITSAFSGACTTEVTDDVENVTESEQEVRTLNGDRLSGVALSGINLGGAHLNGVNYTGMTIGGLALTDVALNGTVLSGRLPNGTIISGTSFIGAFMVGSMSNGSQLTLRIDDIQTSGDSEILIYKVSYRQDGSTYAPLCGLTSGVPQVAVALAGRWDYTAGTPTGGDHINDTTRFTLACRGAAIAKCAEFGYKPWRVTEECTSLGDCHEVDLASLHQACTRMIRADYCGDGASHTVAGTEIDMYDAFGLKGEDSVQWALEAEWTAGGAQCVVHPRWASTSDYGNVVQYIQSHCPERYAPPESNIACGRETSTFFADNGYNVSMDTRVLARNKSELHQ